MNKMKLYITIDNAVVFIFFKLSKMLLVNRDLMVPSKILF